MIGLACIGEPISWLRLETFAAGRGDAAISAHVAACPACAHCLREITSDLVALPPLVVPTRPKRRWWWSLAPAMALAAAAMIVLVVWRTRGAPEREGVVRIKGLDEVVLDVVRERGGVIREDVRSFAPGDRWKVIVTCARSAPATIDVGVIEDGSATSDHPIPRARIACGNRIVIPGAFTLTGTHPNRVCAKIASDHGSDGTACVTIRPE